MRENESEVTVTVAKEVFDTWTRGKFYKDIDGDYLCILCGGVDGYHFDFCAHKIAKAHVC